MKYGVWVALLFIVASTHARAQVQQDAPSDEVVLAQLRAFEKAHSIHLTPAQEEAWLKQQKMLRAGVLNNLVAADHPAVG